MSKYDFPAALAILFNSDLKRRWLENAKEGNLQDMKEVYQQLQNNGLQKEVKNFKDSDGNTALMEAIVSGHLDICQWLVRENLVDVNSKDNGGWNALHVAARVDRPEIAQFLFEKTSVDVNEQSYGGRSALHIAALFNRIEVTRVLLEHEAILLMDDRGVTPLYDARKKKNKEIIQLLKRHYNI